MRDSAETAFYAVLPLLCVAALFRSCSAIKTQETQPPEMIEQTVSAQQFTAMGQSAASGMQMEYSEDTEQSENVAASQDLSEEKESNVTVRQHYYDDDKFVYIDGTENITYEDENYEALQGIDVSDHQGEIDWEQVADAGYEFVFVRVGFRGYGEEGTLNEDTMAIEYMKEAEKAGLEVGAYFFSQAINEEEAAEEARFAAEIIERSGVKLELPLVYDPELAGGSAGRANNLSREQVSNNALAFKKAAEKELSCKVALYANLFWENTYFDEEILNAFEIWYADYEETPQTNCHFTWWQYSETGTVPGIKGNMDLNLWIRQVD